ncbi:MAG TPA: hypothetical protein VIH17_01865 [Candidatus Acidoferrales bacterium]
MNCLAGVLKHATDALGLFRSKDIAQQRPDQFGFFTLPLLAHGGGNVADGIHLDRLHSGFSQLRLDLLCALARGHGDAQSLDEGPEISFAGIRLES